MNNKVKSMNKHPWVSAVIVSAACLFIYTASFAAAAENIQKFQVVNGSDDKAYLVNSSTGLVWVLTYRTTATGREPIAIPYKFIKICPNNQQDFIVEDAKETTCLPGAR